MGFLLLQYEYQRANRQCNLLTRTGIRLNDQIARYTKRISKMESVFSKQKTRLENQYTQKSNWMNSRISSAMSMGPQNLQSAIASCVIGGVSLGQFIRVDDFKAQPGVSTGADDNSQTSQNQAMLAALSNAASQAKAILQTLIQNALEADQEKLEAQENAQLEPISEKEGDLQAEQTTNDALITLWEQRRDAAKEKLPDGIQNSMGHYGIK